MTQVLCLSSLFDEENQSPAPEKEKRTSNFSLEDMPQPQKNTFIHYDIPRSPSNRPPTPTSSAPGMMLSRLFRTIQTKAEVKPLSADADKGLTPCSLSDAHLGGHLTFGEHDDSEASTVAGSIAGSPVQALEVSPVVSFETLDASPTCLTTQVSEEEHLLGHCTPCNYFLYKVDGCRQASECTFCHMCPKGEIKKRKKDKLRFLRKSGMLRRP